MPRIPLTVLVVEDNIELAARVASALTQDGNVVIPADTPALALQLACSPIPDVVLVDLHSSPSSGNELARVLRSSIPWTTPIMMIARDPARPSREDSPDADLVLHGAIELELLGGLMRFMYSRRRGARPVSR